MASIMKKSSVLAALLGHLPVDDAVGILDNQAFARLAEDLVEADNGHRIGAQNLAEDIAGSPRWAAGRRPPTRISLQWGRRAASSDWNSLTSTMLTSSRITTSYFSRFLALWIKRSEPLE